MLQTIIAILVAILVLIWFMRGYFIQRMMRIPAISQEEMERLRNEENAVLLDNRTEKEYRSGHIPGAVHLQAEHAQSSFAGKYPDKERPYIFYCSSGMRSDIVMDQLKAQGYTNLHSFKRLKRYQGELETK